MILDMYLLIILTKWINLAIAGLYSGWKIMYYEYYNIFQCYTKIMIMYDIGNNQ